MKSKIINSLVFVIFLTIICGIIYPMLITVIAQLIFPKQANGTKVSVNGKEVGLYYVGQAFTQEKYFLGRPSATNYEKSGASNVSIYSEEYKKIIEERRKKWKETSNNEKQVPIELLTASGSGLDPDISKESALYQVERIAKARNIEISKLQEIINNMPEEINVLQLNIMLDEMQNK